MFQNKEVQYVYLGTIKQINGEIWNFQVPCITYYIVASHRLSIFGYIIMYFHSTKDRESRIKIFSCIIYHAAKIISSSVENAYTEKHKKWENYSAIHYYTLAT